MSGDAPTGVSNSRKTSLEQLIAAREAIDAADKAGNGHVVDALKDFVRVSSRLEIDQTDDKEEEAYFEVVADSVSTLLECMRNTGMPISARCFASTAFVRFLNPIVKDVHMAAVLMHVLNRSGSQLSGIRITREGDRLIVAPVFDDPKEEDEEEDEDEDEAAQLERIDFCVVLFHGLFGKTTGRLMKAEMEGEPLFMRLFPHIYGLCGSAPVVTAFKMLLKWCEVVGASGVCHDLREKLTRHLIDIYVLVSLHWQNTISGLTPLLAQILSAIFGLPYLRNDVEKLVEHFTCHEFIPPWRSRGILHVIAALVMHAEKIEGKYSMLGCILLECTKDGTLTAAATDVYLATVNRLTWDQWATIYGKAFSLAVFQGNVKVVLTHWLEPTLRHYGRPAVEYLNDKMNLPTEAARRTLLCLYKLVNSLGLEPAQVSSSSWTFLNDESNQSRLYAFDVVCEARNVALGTLPSVQETELILKFMGDNLYVDDQAFRADFLKILPKLFVRLRLGMERLAFEGVPENDPKFLATARLIDGIIRIFKEHCHGASTFQRKATSLGIMESLLDVLVPESPTIIKGANFQPARRGALKSSLERLGFSWEFTEDEDIKRIMLMCSADEDEGIRRTASSVLSKYFSLDPEMLRDLRKAALVMVMHPKQHVSDGGASLSCVVLKQVQKRSPEDAEGNPDLTAQSIWNEALDALTRDFERAEGNLAEAMQYRPIHGHVFHVRTLLLCMTDHLTNEDVKRVIALCRSITLHCLRILSGSDDFPTDCPSFEKIGLAVNRFAEKLLGSKGDGDPEEVMISPEQQKVISFCYQNMKECALLLGDLTLLPREMRQRDILDTSDWKEIGENLNNILFYSRHKGAIESAASAMGQFTRSILEIPTKENQAIVWALVDRALLMVYCADRDTSVTRCGAGFPLLVRSILANEPKTSDMGMFKYMCSFLCKVRDRDAVNREAAGLDVADATAMFILQKLVDDARLASLVMQHIPKLFQKCADYLDSEIWSNRNAALSLLGSLTKRIFGQGKELNQIGDVVDVEDQTACYGLYEFSMKYPNVMHRVYGILKSAGRVTPETDQASGESNPRSSLVPILAFIAKLDVRCSVLTKDVLEKSSILPHLSSGQWRDVFQPLILSPVMAVRKLAAHCAAQFMDEGQLILEWSRWLMAFGNWFTSTVQGRGDVSSSPGMPQIQTSNHAHGCLVYLRRLLLAIGRHQFSAFEYHTIRNYLVILLDVKLGDLILTELMKLRRLLRRFFSLRGLKGLTEYEPEVALALIDGPGGLVERLKPETPDSDPGFEAWKDEVVRFAFEACEPTKVRGERRYFPRHDVILRIMQHLVDIERLDRAVFDALISVFDLCPGYLRLDDYKVLRALLDLAPLATTDQLPSIFRLCFGVDLNDELGTDREIDLRALVRGKGRVLELIYETFFEYARCSCIAPATTTEKEKAHSLLFALKYEAGNTDHRGEELERLADTIARESASLDPYIRLMAAKALRVIGLAHHNIDRCGTERAYTMIANIAGTLVRLLHDENVVVRREAARAASNMWQMETTLGSVRCEHAAPAVRPLVEFLGIRLLPWFRLAAAWTQLALNPFIDVVGLDPPPLFMNFPEANEAPKLPYERWAVLRTWYRIGMAALEDFFEEDVTNFGPWLDNQDRRGEATQYDETDRILAEGSDLSDMEKAKLQEMLDLVKPSKIRALKQFRDAYREKLRGEFVRRIPGPISSTGNDIAWF